MTSTRDGMNLVSFEYIAAQKTRHGSLILSEFVGAADKLKGSIIVNPWNTQQASRAILQAMTMSDEERAERHKKLTAYVHTYTRYFSLMCYMIIVDALQSVVG